jgi:hypothetical protein
MECENEFLACFKNVSCCPQKAMDDYVSGTDISPIHWKQLCTLRALLAHGLLAHGLELRYRVDYGLDKVHGRVKKMAVPYRAADVPTERSEFSHPDKCLLVTKLSYYYDGLSTEALHDSIKRLLGLGLAAQNFYHDLWFEDIKGEELKAKDDSYAKIDMVSKLDLTNAKQVSFLYATYRYCRSTISFWINNFVVPVDMMQYPEKMSASSWNLPSQKSMGFSGTKDLEKLLPLQVCQNQPRSVEILSTDAIMLEKLLAAEFKQVKHSEQQRAEDLPIWKIILTHVLEDDLDARIGAGSLLAGVTNADAAEFLIQHSTGVSPYTLKRQDRWPVSVKALVLRLRSADRARFRFCRIHTSCDYHYCSL